MSLADYLKILGDLTRLRIINLLLFNPGLRVKDIVEVLELPQSTVSRHLAQLRQSGWVEDKRVDVWVQYRISRKVIPELKVALEKLFSQDIMFQNDILKLKSMQIGVTGSRG